MIAPQTHVGDWTGLLRVTKSQLAVYLMCPRKFYYDYVLRREPEFRPLAMVFGSAIHDVVGAYYRHMLVGNPQPSAEWLLDDWRGVWNRAALEPNIQWGEHSKETMFAVGAGLLKAFAADVQPRTIEAVEYPFEVDLLDPDTGLPLDVKLVGLIDLIESDDDGNLIVAETKTASKRMADAAAESQLDGLVYAYAMSQLGYQTTAEGETLVRYDVMVKTKTPSFQQVYVTKEPGDYRRLVRWIKSILQSIESESFHPVVGWACKGCQHADACKKELAA